MINMIAKRMAGGNGAGVRARRDWCRGEMVRPVIVASVMMAAIFAGAFGGSAAAEEAPASKSEPAAVVETAPAAAAPSAESAAPAAPVTPVSLAGRWVGHRYSYAKTNASGGCPDGACAITYDIVACGNDWCGIEVSKDGKTCGLAGLKLGPKAQETSGRGFDGKWEVVKGAAVYSVDAWFIEPEKDNPEEKPRLTFVGDTGELVLMRRSFPFEASLERVAEAQCTLHKATS